MGWGDSVFKNGVSTRKVNFLPLKRGGFKPNFRGGILPYTLHPTPYPRPKGASVTRQGKRGDKAYHERVYYISSLKLNASEFSKIIREHWLIENQLHWIKDVVLGEDNSRIRSGMAPHNFSIIRSIVINLLRKKGYQSLTQAQRMIANNINELFLCLT